MGTSLKKWLKNLCVAKPYFQLVLNKQGLQNQDIATIIAKAYLAGAYIGGLCVKQSYDKAEKLLADVFNANGALVVGHGKNLGAKNFAQPNPKGFSHHSAHVGNNAPLKHHPIQHTNGFLTYSPITKVRGF